VGRTGIVDENVQRAEGGERLFDHSRDIGFFAHIAAERDGVITDDAGGGLRRLGIDVGQSDPRAFADISLRNAFADAGAGAGYERALALKTHEADAVAPRRKASPNRGRPRCASAACIRSR
jgi:hypothetical protein